MKKEEVKLVELFATHPDEGCRGIMVPKFFFLTSERKLKISGYCIKCGQGMLLEHDLAALEKMCPSSADDFSRKELETGQQAPSFSDQLLEFNPPAGSKPQ